MEVKSQGNDASVVHSDNVVDQEEALAEVHTEVVVAVVVVDTADVDLAVMVRCQKVMTLPENLKENVEPEMVQTVQIVHQDAVDSDDSEALLEVELAVNVAAHADQDHHAVVIIPTLKTKK